VNANLFYLTRARNRISVLPLSALLLVVSLLPVATHAQFIFVTNADNTVKITSYTGSGGDVIIPGTTNGLLVTMIARWSFAQRYHLRSVTVPPGVTNVEDQAFYECYNLGSVYFLGDTPTVGPYTFGGDQNSVFYVYGSRGWGSTFAGRPTGLWDPARHLIYAITNNAIVLTDYIGNESDVALPSSLNGMPVVTIGENACLLCTFTNITIPNSVTNVGESAFGDCNSLTSIMIPETVCGAADYWFAYCTNLTTISIPSTLTRLGYGLFLGCSSLREIIIRGNIDLVLDQSFGYCANLRGIYFTGNAPAFIGPRAFENTSGATIYYLPGTTGWTTTLGACPTGVWQPMVQTSDSSFGVGTNVFGFNINWASGRTVVVEACSDLVCSGWLPLQTNTLGSEPLYFSDPQWANYPSRFYRIRSP
jgi:hypothetical protein